MMNKCTDCRHYSWNEPDSSDGHEIETPWPSCHARKGVQNLRQFPFASTPCDKFQQDAE